MTLKKNLLEIMIFFSSDFPSSYDETLHPLLNRVLPYYPDKSKDSSMKCHFFKYKLELTCYLQFHHNKTHQRRKRWFITGISMEFQG